MKNSPAWSRTFANDGGPLIVLPRELLGDWRGGDPPPVGAELSSDYARACKAEYPAELLPVGPGSGLVIGSQEMVYTASWLKLSESGKVFLVGWEYADEGADSIVTDLLQNSQLEWQRLSPRIVLADGGLLLLHAASMAGTFRELDTFGSTHAVIGHAIPLRLEPSAYDVEATEIRRESGSCKFSCVICGWVRASPSKIK